MYAYLNENGNVLEIHNYLPETWKNISGLSGLSGDELRAINWIELEGSRPQIDPTVQILSNPNISISGENGNFSGSVTWSVILKNKDEIIKVLFERIDDLREENIARGAIVDLGDSNGPFTVQTRGELDTRNITGLAGVATTALLLGQPFSADFRDQDDQVHTLNAQQVLMLQAQIAVWVQSHYYTAWTHKANLKALYDSDDIQGMVDYDISQGWP